MVGFYSDCQKLDAKRQRSNMTESKKRLWSVVRAHRFHGVSVRRKSPMGPSSSSF
ncbi:MAG: hypothetical protein CSA70_06775 [Rhodobacterales bacterium]|nr:MAG: hypothetical protein CSA70_06775 [Rhodobacterales bacterium]